MLMLPTLCSLYRSSPMLASLKTPRTVHRIRSPSKLKNNFSPRQVARQTNVVHCNSRPIVSTNHWVNYRCTEIHFQPWCNQNTRWQYRLFLHCIYDCVLHYGEFQHNKPQFQNMDVVFDETPVFWKSPNLCSKTGGNTQLSNISFALFPSKEVSQKWQCDTKSHHPVWCHIQMAMTSPWNWHTGIPACTSKHNKEALCLPVCFNLVLNLPHVESMFA